jgi:hypothetical protein
LLKAQTWLSRGGIERGKAMEYDSHIRNGRLVEVRIGSAKIVCLISKARKPPTLSSQVT